MCHFVEQALCLVFALIIIDIDTTFQSKTALMTFLWKLLLFMGRKGMMTNMACYFHS
jgi:hypothetical protein